MGSIPANEPGEFARRWRHLMGDLPMPQNGGRDQSYHAFASRLDDVAEMVLSLGQRVHELSGFSRLVFGDNVLDEARAAAWFSRVGMLLGALASDVHAMEAAATRLRVTAMDLVGAAR